MKDEFVLHSICDGQVVSLHDAPSPVSPEDWGGEGLAFVLKEGEVVAPGDGKLRRLPDGLRSVGMVLDNGMQIHFYVGHLMEISGLDFDLQCREHQQVHKGDPLFRLTRKADCACQDGLVIPMLIRRHRDFGDFEFSYYAQEGAVAGETVVIRYRKQ